MKTQRIEGLNWKVTNGPKMLAKEGSKVDCMHQHGCEVIVQKKHGQENDTIYRKKREINKKNQGDYGCGACRVVCGRVQWKWGFNF